MLMREMQEMQVGSLGWEDPPEKEMAISFSILAWKIPWTEQSGEPQYMVSQRVRHDWVRTHTHMKWKRMDNEGKVFKNAVFLFLYKLKHQSLLIPILNT